MKRTDLSKLKAEVSSRSSRNTEFENVLKALLENPSDENLDRINQVRASLVESGQAIADITSKLESLTKTLSDPTPEDLGSVADIVFLGRQMLARSGGIISAYEPLWQRGVIIAETDAFLRNREHLADVLDGIEGFYFK